MILLMIMNDNKLSIYHKKNNEIDLNSFYELSLLISYSILILLDFFK